MFSFYLELTIVIIVDYCSFERFGNKAHGNQYFSLNIFFLFLWQNLRIKCHLREKKIVLQRIHDLIITKGKLNSSSIRDLVKLKELLQWKNLKYFVCSIICWYIKFLFLKRRYNRYFVYISVYFLFCFFLDCFNAIEKKRKFWFRCTSVCNSIWIIATTYIH